MLGQIFKNMQSIKLVDQIYPDHLNSRKKKFSIFWQELQKVCELAIELNLKNKTFLY